MRCNYFRISLHTARWPRQGQAVRSNNLLSSIWEEGSLVLIELLPGSSRKKLKTSRMNIKRSQLWQPGPPCSHTVAWQAQPLSQLMHSLQTSQSQTQFWWPQSVRRYLKILYIWFCRIFIVLFHCCVLSFINIARILFSILFCKKSTKHLYKKLNLILRNGKTKSN